MNIIPMPEKPDDLKKALAEAKAKLPVLLEYMEIEAQMTRKRFEVLVANGFTEVQALELCKKP